MTALLGQALAEMQRLSLEQQDAIAAIIIPTVRNFNVPQRIISPSRSLQGHAIMP
jgi:hypothetical protein